VSLALTLAALWALVASLVAMLADPRWHWPVARLLVLAGLPVLALVFWRHGVLVGLLVLAGAASVLRWPLIRLWQRLARRFHG